MAGGARPRCEDDRRHGADRPRRGDLRPAGGRVVESPDRGVRLCGRRGRRSRCRGRQCRRRSRGAGGRAQRWRRNRLDGVGVRRDGGGDRGGQLGRRGVRHRDWSAVDGRIRGRVRAERAAARTDRRLCGAPPGTEPTEYHHRGDRHRCRTVQSCVSPGRRRGPGRPGAVDSAGAYAAGRRYRLHAGHRRRRGRAITGHPGGDEPGNGPHHRDRGGGGRLSGQSRSRRGAGC